MNDFTHRYAIPVSISLSVFVGLLFGFPHGKAPQRQAEVIMVASEPWAKIPPTPPEADETIVDAKPAPKETQISPPDIPDVAVVANPVIDFVQPLRPTFPPTENVSFDHIPLEADMRQIGPGGPPIIDSKYLKNHPHATFQPAPQYPYEMKAGSIEGSVTVEFVVETDGAVSLARVVSSTNTAFEEPALQAVRHWRFEPGMSEGKRVRFRMAQPLSFKLAR